MCGLVFSVQAYIAGANKMVNQSDSESDDTLSLNESEGSSQEAPLSDFEGECWYCTQCDMQVWDPKYPSNGVNHAPCFVRVCLGCNQSFRFCDTCYNQREWHCWTCEQWKYSQDESN